MLLLTIILITVTLVSSNDTDCLNNIEAKLKMYKNILKVNPVKARTLEVNMDQNNDVEDRANNNGIMNIIQSGTSAMTGNNPLGIFNNLAGGSGNGITIIQGAIGSLYNVSQNVNQAMITVVDSMVNIGSNGVLQGIGGGGGTSKKVDQAELKEILVDIQQTVSSFTRIIKVIDEIFNDKDSKLNSQ